MRTVFPFLVLAWIMAAAWASDSVPAVSLFAIPSARLNTDALKSPDPQPEKLLRPDTATNSAFVLTQTQSSASIDLNTRLAVYETMNGHPVLTQIPVQPELDGALGWLDQKVLDPLFSPEVVRLGKVKVTGGIVAAIKRKNPFCLLNPLVFAAGW